MGKKNLKVNDKKRSNHQQNELETLLEKTFKVKEP
jgi:hypothetical protein